MNIHHQQTQNIPRFQGKMTTFEARKRFLSDAEMVEIFSADCKASRDPYLGEIPDFMVKETEQSPEKLRKKLDTLAEKLLEIYYTDYVGGGHNVKIQEKLEAISRNFRIPLKYIGGNGNAHVFRIRLGDRWLVLRIPRTDNNARIPNPGFHMLHASKILLHLNRLGTSDVPDFYCANPHKNWALLEFIDENADVKKRAGKPMESHGFHNTDKKSGNYINQVCVDPDYIEGL